MAMSFDTAVKIVVARRKLYDLRAKAPQDQIAKIDSQIQRLDPYKDEANNTVMAKSDAAFKAAAATLSAQTKDIDAAIADIGKLAQALTQMAAFITGILKVIQAVGGLP